MQDFPYEPDIYPFAFDLEPLSRTSLAKYVYAEAPEDALRMDRAKSEDDVAFLHGLSAALGGEVRLNHVGSLYGTIIELLRELPNSKALAKWPDLDAWTEKLERIKDEGEADHYEFFKSLFLAQHDGFGQVSQIWNLSADDPAYPSYALPANPSGFVGHDNQILYLTTLALAQLSNLHYWIVLCLLDVSYRDAGGRTRSCSLPAPICSVRSRFWPAIFRTARWHSVRSTEHGLFPRPEPAGRLADRTADDRRG